MPVKDFLYVTKFSQDARRREMRRMHKACRRRNRKIKNLRQKHESLISNIKAEARYMIGQREKTIERLMKIIRGDADIYSIYFESFLQEKND